MVDQMECQPREQHRLHVTRRDEVAYSGSLSGAEEALGSAVGSHFQQQDLGAGIPVAFREVAIASGIRTRKYDGNKSAEADVHETGGTQTAGNSDSSAGNELEAGSAKTRTNHAKITKSCLADKDKLCFKDKRSDDIYEIPRREEDRMLYHRRRYQGGRTWLIALAVSKQVFPLWKIFLNLS